MSDTTVTIMNKNTGYVTTFGGDVDVKKSTTGDEWLIMKWLSDEELKLYGNEEGRNVFCHKYPVVEHYIILN